MTLYVNNNLFWKLEHLKPALRWRCIHFLSTLYIKSLIQDKSSEFIDEAEIGLSPSPISSQISKKIYGSGYWGQMVTKLKEIGAISVGSGYKPKKKCKKFRLLPPNNREIRRFSLNFDSLHQRLLKTQEIQSYAAAKGAGAEWVIESFKASSISGDPDAVLAGLNLKDHALNCAEASLDGLKKRQINFSRCDAGRLFYPVTSLKRELRKLILLNGEETCEVDASASQPVLHASLYLADCVERRRYIEFVTSPRFYETVAEWGGFLGPRDDCKKLVFRDLFYGSIFRDPPSPIWLHFKREFPLLAAQMEAEKRKGRSVLPLLMQRTEAEIVIDTACRALHEARIPVLTVHDSIIVPVSKKWEAQEIFRRSWLSKVGFEPKFKS